MPTRAAVAVQHLRSELETRFGGAILSPPADANPAARPGFEVGVFALDRLLPEGVPCGLLSLWSGPATSGRTAAVRSLIKQACAADARVALVDATGTLDPASWCSVGPGFDGLWVVRPPGPDRGHEGCWAGEALLRTGAFDLVVIDGPPPIQTEAHRLRALARETDAALLVSADQTPSGWRADLRLEFHRGGVGSGLRGGGRFRRPVRVRVAKGWGNRTGEREVELVEDPAHRLYSSPVVPDRRPRRGD